MEKPTMPASMMSGVHNTIEQLQDKVAEQQALIDKLVKGLRYANRMLRPEEADRQYIKNLITKATNR